MGYYSYSATLRIYKNDGTDAYYENQRSGQRDVPQGTTFYVYVPTLETGQSPYTREGYDLLGYKLNNVQSYSMTPIDTTVSFQFTGSGSQTARFYCQWQLKTYTINYDANGGTGAPAAQTKTHGTALTLSSAVPTRENYNFFGWATSSTGAVEYQPGDSFTVNANTTLYAIWAVAGGSLTSVTDTEIEATGTAVWTKVNNTHAYKLKASFGGAPVVTVNVPAGSTTCNFTIPATWYNYITNATSGTATAVLETYTDANYTDLVGTTSQRFTVSVASSVKPAISAFTATPHSNNATVESWDVAAQGLSYATLAVTAVAGTGASISSIAFTGPEINQIGTGASGNTGILTTIGTNTFTVDVTDSRGRTATATVSLTVYEYSNPVISALEAVRCLQDGTASDTEGGYLKAKPTFVFSSVDGNNALSVKKVEYKEHSATTWTTATAAAVSESWTSVFGPADVTKSFDVKCTITDLLGNTYALEVIVLPVTVCLHLGLNNDRARFGGPVNEEGLVCDWKFKLKDDFIMRDGNGNSATLTYSDLVALLALIQ